MSDRATRRFLRHKAALVVQETPFSRAPDLQTQLSEFNEQRRILLDSVPTGPEGNEVLLAPWGSPGGRGPEPEYLRRRS